jgi:hypothetical protein
VLNRVLTEPADKWPQLFDVFGRQADLRHLQVYFHDQALETAAASVHYDGSLVPAPSDDYLLVTDANVGANKEDIYLKKSLNVKAEVAPGGMVRHQVSATYDLPQPIDDLDRALNPGKASYRNYVRFYLPPTAVVAGFGVTVDGKSAPGNIDQLSVEHDHSVVGTFLRLPRGHTAVMTLSYEVPIGEKGNYNLYLQKQAGQLTLPTTIDVSYPGGVTSRRSALTRDETVAVSW